MPRRPSKKLGGRSAKPNAAKPVNRNDSKISKWDKASDIPLDDQDQFHASRDKILLEDNEYENDDDGDEEEVFGLKGMIPDSDSDEGAGAEEDVDMEEYEGEEPAPKKKKSKKQAAKAAAASSSSESESEQEATWGRSKAAYYSSNAAQLESDDEEGNDLEEAEAKRLQTTARQAMGEHDFGLDDPIEVAPPDDDTLAEPVASAPLPALPTDKKLLLWHLEKTSPEALALARDWDDTAWNLTSTQAKIAKVEAENPDALSLGMSHLHYQALLTYATTLAFYLHLRASEKYSQRPELLQAHPILGRLLALKHSLSTLEDLDFNVSDFAEDDEEEDEEEDENLEEEDSDESIDMDEMMADANQLWSLDRKKGLESGELADLLQDAIKSNSSPKADGSSSPPPTTEKSPKKKRKPVATIKPTPVFDLIEPIFSKSSSSRGNTDSGITDAYGEASSLQHADAADKSARVKTLRFHTSKIESASARRQGARLNAAGGDDDIPYRERKRGEKVVIKGRGQGGADLDDAEPEGPSNGKRRRDNDDEGGESEPEEGADGYYELVKRKSKEKKDRKKADYEALVAAEKPTYVDEDPHGPRSLTRAIMANKGLTPHRPKSVRNPRVKKRLKFEKAKKKISSQKATYSGGIGDVDKYSGEKSGISKVVKSVRLG